MPLLPSRKKHISLKREAVYALLSLAVLVVGALCFTSFSGALQQQLSCRFGETTDAQLLAEVLQKLTLLGHRMHSAGLADAVSASGAATPAAAGPDEPDARGAYLGSAARAVTPKLDDRMQVTVPLQLWQSVRSYDGNSLATAMLFNSWTTNNPQWDHFLFDKLEMLQFVEKKYDEETLDLFQAMPLDQMRVDVFRFMVLHHNGGVYADLDTLCMKNAAIWAPRGCRFVAAASADAPSTLSLAVVASVAGDDTIEAVLTLMLERMRGFKALLEFGAAAADIAFNTTGAGAFTDAVIMHVGALAGGQETDVPGLLQAKSDLRGKGVCLLTAEEMAQCAVQAEVGREWDRGLQWDEVV